MRKIHDSLAGHAGFFHWSDMDLGGFNIFVRLKENIIPELKPHRMDVDTISSCRTLKSLEKDDYREALRKLLSDERFAVFHDVIHMLEHDVKLEQESLI